MQMKNKKKRLSLILCTMLTVAMAFTTTGCNGSTKNETPATDTAAVSAAADSTVMGGGKHKLSVYRSGSGRKRDPLRNPHRQGDSRGSLIRTRAD